MSLAYIIQEVCEKCGYDPVDNRVLILRNINRACKELYERTDLPGSLREVTVLVGANTIVALPYYVGELRAIRGHYTLEKIPLREMASRYTYQNWPEQWNKWRVLRKSPLKNCIENSALPIYVTIDEVDTVEVNITVTGSTETASRVSETVTLEIGETTTQLSNDFTDIFSITKDVVNNRNITLTGADSDGNEIELSVIPNDKLNVVYTLVDISLLPSAGDNGTAYRYVDVLYKEPLPTLADDGDEFICQGFDDAISNKVCEYYYAAQDDGSVKAVEFHEKCEEIMARRIEHVNGETEKMLTFAPNPLLGLYPNSWQWSRMPFHQM